MLETTYTLIIGQLLKITLDFFLNMWQELKPKKPNIDIKVIPKPRIAILIETHSQANTIVIKVNN